MPKVTESFLRKRYQWKLSRTDHVDSLAHHHDWKPSDDTAFARIAKQGVHQETLVYVKFTSLSDFRFSSLERLVAIQMVCVQVYFFKHWRYQPLVELCVIKAEEIKFQYHSSVIYMYTNSTLFENLLVLVLEAMSRPLIFLSIQL